MMLFNQPIFLDKGRYVQEIATLEDALDFLEEWSGNKRELAYETVASACLRPMPALTGASRQVARHQHLDASHRLS
ncbi:hypothetical protein REJC140_03563 [Pseudorhizobium endolithicum]|uniref:DUF982 domain-containing protein n=1 Tax=Pseudorhizobium endolithicum TaxID=1191678 RepID=A0ABM8PLL4_9HYPH|nr:DUF982 domain-containing protein [Pseudorhizobium endolithicum]CAD7036661.1 hypothetical protein REJC140_03563 [Pseudorhizobium endolithicum]